jgi:Fe-S oxidoreductase
MVTWKQTYPKVVGKLSFEVRSVAEVVAEAINEGRIELSRAEEKLTYQDPCRLGRHTDIYNAPREVLASTASLEEMPRSREMAACCGNSSFVNCGPQTRLWQLERLKEGAGTGAECMITACPKCLIHFTCAMSEGVQLVDRPRMPIKDLHVHAASRLKRGRRA